MSGKIIEEGLNSQSKIIEGVKKTADAIKVTMGPSGKCVAITNFGLGIDPEVTRDGATVAKSIDFKDEHSNIGARLVKKAASLTEELAGDGTSTTSVLIKELCIKGQKSLKAGSNVNEIKSGMLKAGAWVADYIKSKSIKIDGDIEKIRKVATISANNDPEVGNLVVECMSKVGVDGVITADLASGLDTVIDVTVGMKLDRGWASPQYVTSPEDGLCTMENPYIITIGERISSVNQILPLLNLLVPTGRPFLFIVDEMDDVVSSTLVLNNLRGAFRTCVVKGIDFGDSRKNIMSDISIACGGTFFCKEKNNDIKNATLSDLGQAGKVIISKNSCIIFEGAGDKDEVKALVEILKARLNDPTTSSYDKSKFESRIANLAGGIGIIKAGGATEAEKLNRKATIEDSILAAKSAIEEGCAPGSGYVYYKASIDIKKDKEFWKSLNGDEVEGAEIVISSLPVIMKTVADNSGVSGEVVLSEVGKKSFDTYYGFNAKTKKYGNLISDGILDSTKVLRVALQNAISTASMILLIDCTITNEPEKASDSPLLN